MLTNAKEGDSVVLLRDVETRSSTFKKGEIGVISAKMGEVYEILFPTNVLFGQFGENRRLAATKSTKVLALLKHKKNHPLTDIFKY